MKPLLVAFMLSAVSTVGLAENPALRNFRELFYFYSHLTGVSSHDPELRAALTRLQDRLPAFGRVDEFNTSGFFASAELSAQFCKKQIKHEKSLSPKARQYYYDVDFEQGPKQWPADQVPAFAERILERFWYRNINDQELEVIRETIFWDSFNQESPEDTLVAVQMICMLGLTSLEVLSY